MMYRHILRTTVLATTISTTFAASESGLQFSTKETEWKKSKLFNTKILAVPQKVEDILISKKYGFEKTKFTTPDGLNLECLVRKVENPACTVVISAGFCKGRMTGMTTLVKMLPKNCNIIFYNGRGKGNSDGSPLPLLWNFGTHGYKDVIGAFTYAKEFNAPIVSLGTCAGSFLNAQALKHLQKTDKLKEYDIRAHIMDSSVGDLPTTIERIPQYFLDLTSWKGWFANICLWALRYTIFHRRFLTSGDDSRINGESLAKTNIPTLHFDCKTGDIFTPYETTDALYRSQLSAMSNPDLCKKHTFDESRHASHWLKHKKEYAFVLANFMNEHVG